MMTRYVNAHIEARHSPQKQEPPKLTPYDMVLNAQGSLDDVVERVERVRRVERAEKISPPQPAKAIVPQVPIESGGLVPSPSDGHRPCWLPHKATGDQKSKATATIVTHEDDPLEPGSLSSRAAGGRRGNPDLMGLREGVTLPAASWDLQDDFSVQAVRPARVYSIAAANGIPEPKGHQGLSQEDLEGLGADRPLAMAPVAAPASTSDLPPDSMSPGMPSTVWGCPSLHMSDIGSGTGCGHTFILHSSTALHLRPPGNSTPGIEGAAQREVQREAGRADRIEIDEISVCGRDVSC